MARRSQTDMAVLGALSMQPMTAYALREAIREVLGHFWRESFGQIYPALSALEEDGLVRRRQAERPGSSTFAITPAGRARLSELLTEPITRTTPRNGLLLRLFFGRTLGPDACRNLLREAAADAQRQAAEYEALAGRVRTEDAGSPDLPYQLITLAAGRHGAQATLAWVAEALRTLEQAGAAPAAADTPDVPRNRKDQP